MERRYQVVTYSSDIGSDEKKDFARLSEAVRDAKKYRKTEEYAAVYDRITKTAFVVFGAPWLPVFADFVDVTVF
jgi:hypothetical protein